MVSSKLKTVKKVQKKLKRRKYVKHLLEDLPVKDNYPIVDSKSRAKKTKL